jgi:ribosomal protein S18 acetylase RimI-like enzyme
MSEDGDPRGHDWAIRPFVMEDYAAVLRLWQTAGAGLTIRPSDRPEEVARKCTRDGDLFLVAEQDGQVIGIIMGAWDGRRGWLHHLAVDAAHRGRGIASSLVATVEERLRDRGCLKVNLLVSRANLEARALYRRLGYDEMNGFLPMGKEL